MAPLDSWDYQLLAYLAYANLTTLYLAGLVLSSRSKFATLAGLRLALVSVFLEFIFTLCFLL